MANGQGVPLGPIAVATVGGLLVYGALTNRSILEATRDIMTGKTPSPVSTASSNAPPDKAITDALGSAGDTTGKLAPTNILTGAKHYIGTKYAWAKANPYDGFDCSGLVNYVIGHDLNWPIPGYPLGHKQFDGSSHGPIVGQWFTTDLCTTVATPAPGDLVIWGPNTHIGVYAGGGQMVDAPDLGQNVKQEKVWSPPSPIYRRYVGMVNQLSSPTTGALVTK
jgi:cell wall-associated NlpC family hydrolase